jgi:hypothetical protein
MKDICFFERVRKFKFKYVMLVTQSVLRLLNIRGRMVNDYGSGVGMKIAKGDQSTQRKPASVPNLAALIGIH